MGKPEPDLEKLRIFVGPPLKEQFMQYAGFTSEEGDLAVKYYRERYTETGIYENYLYPGVEKMLKLFEKNGIKMAVASSKPEIFVKRVLEYFKIDRYFTVIVGSELNGKRTDKSEVIEEAIRQLGMKNRKAEIVMVGDRKFDVTGARELGLACIGVTYGYGDMAEIREANPDCIATQVLGVAECMIQQLYHKKKETVPYKIWRILYPMGIHYGLMALVSSIWSLAVVAVQMALYGNLDFNSIMEIILKQNNLIILVSSAITLPIVMWLYHKDEAKRKELGISRRLMGRGKFGVCQMLLVAAFSIMASTVLNQLIAVSGLNEIFDTYAELAEYMFDPHLAIVNIISVGILAPIVEEVVFRGLLYRRLRDYSSVLAAIIISALIFGIYHGNVVQAIYASILGAILAILYERYKNIWAPILAHMAANIYATIGNMANFSVEVESFAGVLLFFFIEIVATVILGVMIFKTKSKNTRT